MNTTASNAVPPPASLLPLILVVEDHEPTRFLRTRILQNAGFLVRGVATAADAVATVVAGSRPPAAVVLDVGLPDGDGYSVCERLKAAVSHLPVVMITSVYRTSQARRDGFAAGADAYLIEPTPPGLLVLTLRQLLDREPENSGVSTAVVSTGTDGRIISTDVLGARLLNVAPRGMRGRLIQLFFDDRVGVMHGLEVARTGHVFEGDLVVHPRERKRVRVHLDVSLNPEAQPPCLDWRMTPQLVTQTRAGSQRAARAT